jgi:hypothetical protein
MFLERGETMKLVIAYIRTECAAHVIRGRVGGITCYMVHGMRSEKPTFLYSTRPFEVHHPPASLKLEWFAPMTASTRLSA